MTRADRRWLRSAGVVRIPTDLARLLTGRPAPASHGAGVWWQQPTDRAGVAEGEAAAPARTTP
jgi:hypothetical protein